MRRLVIAVATGRTGNVWSGNHCGDGTTVAAN